MSLHLCLPISIVKTKPNLLSVARYFCSSANSHCKLYKPPIIILIYILSHVTEFQWASSTNNQKLNTAETYYTRNWNIFMNGDINLCFIGSTSKSLISPCFCQQFSSHIWRDGLWKHNSWQEAADFPLK